VVAQIHGLTKCYFLSQNAFM